MFENAIFKFSPNGKADISLPMAPKQSEIEMMFSNSLWIFSDKKSVIRIGTIADQYTLLGIKAELVNGAMQFRLLEGDALLVVEKQL